MMPLIIFRAAGSPPAPRSKRCFRKNSDKTKVGDLLSYFASQFELMLDIKTFDKLLKFLDLQLVTR